MNQNFSLSSVNEWRPFIDPSIINLKAVLLHNGNTKPSMPVAYAVNMKKSYEPIKTLLEAYLNT